MGLGLSELLIFHIWSYLWTEEKYIISSFYLFLAIDTSLTKQQILKNYKLDTVTTKLGGWSKRCMFIFSSGRVSENIQ